MLQLNNITKTYLSGEDEVKALKGVSLQFRKSEFVSILGPSGCGKTTMLNIIGGLDRYTDGDLIINGKSTKEFKDRDWDSYRNHSIGFVFQSYNLIPHQTVLSNVELALTISGATKAERKAKAEDVLAKVGLANQLKKKPSQMSGGQMQRVAIARAIVNNPDILLADEPTGALDTETSIQIMDILKDIAKDRLVIMVTHNPELAERYSTRIVKLLDGQIISDSRPYDIETEAKAEAEESVTVTAEESGAENTNVTESEGETVKEEQSAPQKPTFGPEALVLKLKRRFRKVKKTQPRTSMSFFTAVMLSFNNLLTKKARTLLTAFAGSIGIIGIALILSLSNGIQAYINQIQQQTLSSYPIAIEREYMDYTELMTTLTETAAGEGEVIKHEDGSVYSSSNLEKLMDMLKNVATNSSSTNNLKEFKKFIEADGGELSKYTGGVQYVYDADINAYTVLTDTLNQTSYYQANPSNLVEDIAAGLKKTGDSTATFMASYMSFFSDYLSFWTEMIEGVKDSTLDKGVPELLNSQYEVVAGSWTDFTKTAADYKNQGYAEVMLVVDSNNEISQLALYSMGFLPRQNLIKSIENMMNGEEILMDSVAYDYEEVLNNWKFKLMLTGDMYQENGNSGIWSKKTEVQIMEEVPSEEMELRVVGIIRPKDRSFGGAINGTIAYTKALTEYVIDAGAETPAALTQRSKPTVDIFTGRPFVDTSTGELSMELVDAYIAMLKGYLTEYAGTVGGGIVDGLTNSVRVEGDPVQTVANIVSTVNGYISEKPELSSVVGLLKTQIGDVTSAEGLTDYLLNDFKAINTYESNMIKLGAVDYDNPSAIMIYSNTFENKDKIAEIIAEYNAQVRKDTENMTPEQKLAYAKTEIHYTDYIGLALSAVTMIINAITYGLIAFVAISLIVSSIMIGIITYISVLERTKEIGVLRSVGARKVDVSNVFNAETLILGFGSGALGIIITLLLSLPINLILKALTGISGMCQLPPLGAVVLILISMLLTFVSGLIPASMAAKRDPVEALRSE